MFSFGPIKYATAWQGALSRYRDREVMLSVRRIQTSFPKQTSLEYMKRAIKYSLLWFGMKAFCYWLVCRMVDMLGYNHQEVLVPLLRSFMGPDSEYFKRLRLQPSAPLLIALARRLSQPNTSAAANRSKALKMIKLLPPNVEVPGRESKIHNFWLFPVIVGDRDRICARLQSAGVDASTSSTQLSLITRQSDEPPTEPTPVAERMLKNICYLPVQRNSPDWLLHTISDVLTRETKDTPPPHTAPRL